MTYVRPQSARYVLVAYPFGGLLIGVAVPMLKSFAAAHFGRPGFAVAFVVNIAMPLLIVALAAIHPRFSTALAGAFAATVAFLASVGALSAPLNSGWLHNIVAQMGPILTVACIAYHLLAVATVATLRPFRRVGHPPNPDACPHCGYLLIGIPTPRCPECGHARTAGAPPRPGVGD